MQARIKNPAFLVPGAMEAIQAVGAATRKSGLPQTTYHLIHLRVSQINGCGVCIDGGVRHAREDGETDQRLHAVAAWRDAPYFNPAERAALALAEAVTRMSDRNESVPDDVWNEAAQHYGEKDLAALVLSVATTNLWNRLNVATRQVAGSW